MNALDSALYSRLQGTAITNLLPGTTSIYHLQAPDNATKPFIVWYVQGGGDENHTAHRTKNLVVFIRAYSGVSAAQAGSIDTQIDTALHLAPLTVTGWGNLWIARETDLELPEVTPSGVTAYMAGGTYRIRLEKT